MKIILFDKVVNFLKLGIWFYILGILRVFWLRKIKILFNYINWLIRLGKNELIFIVE